MSVIDWRKQEIGLVWSDFRIDTSWSLVCDDSRWINFTPRHLVWLGYDQRFATLGDWKHILCLSLKEFLKAFNYFLCCRVSLCTDECLDACEVEVVSDFSRVAKWRVGVDILGLMSNQSIWAKIKVASRFGKACLGHQTLSRAQVCTN